MTQRSLWDYADEGCAGERRTEEEREQADREDREALAAADVSQAAIERALADAPASR